jgi:hypothetical protein
LDTKVNILRIVVVEGCESLFLVPTSGGVVGEVTPGMSAVCGGGLIALFLGFKFFGASKGAGGKVLGLLL